MKVTEIKVEAVDITQEDLFTMKKFGVCHETSDGFIHSFEHEIEQYKEQILESFFMRLKADADKLIEWRTDGKSVTALLRIIPAVNYNPLNGE